MVSNAKSSHNGVDGWEGEWFWWVNSIEEWMNSYIWLEDLGGQQYFFESWTISSQGSNVRINVIQAWLVCVHVYKLQSSRIYMQSPCAKLKKQMNDMTIYGNHRESMLCHCEVNVTLYLQPISLVTVMRATWVTIFNHPITLPFTYINILDIEDNFKG